MKYKTKIINDFVLLKKQAEKIQIKIDSLNFKMTEYLTNSVMDRDESQIKKFRNAKKQIIKRAECWRSCGLIN
jgi:hypothetical protein